MPLDPAFSLTLPLAQICAWVFWARRLKKGPARLFLGFWYLAVNTLAISVLINWYWTSEPPPSNPVAWNFFYRPILLWELVHLAWVLLWAIAFLASAPSRLIARSKAKGLPSLFRAKTDSPPVFGLRLALLLVLLGAAGLGYLRQLPAPEIERVEAEMPFLPSDLENASVALISDLHYGRGANFSDLEAIFEILQLYRPDIVIFTGTIVDKNPEFGLHLSPLISSLAPPYGAYAAFDRSFPDPVRLAQTLRQAGVQPLAEGPLILASRPLTLVAPREPANAEESQAPIDSNSESPQLAPKTGSPVANPQSSAPQIQAQIASQASRLILAVTPRPHPASEIASLGARLYLTGPIMTPYWSRLLGPNLTLLGFNPAADPAGIRRDGELAILVGHRLNDTLPILLGPAPKITLLTLKAQRP